jgi:hypothetical protein
VLSDIKPHWMNWLEHAIPHGAQRVANRKNTGSLILSINCSASLTAIITFVKRTTTIPKFLPKIIINMQNTNLISLNR